MKIVEEWNNISTTRKVIMIIFSLFWGILILLSAKDVFYSGSELITLSIHTFSLILAIVLFFVFLNDLVDIDLYHVKLILSDYGIYELLIVVLLVVIFANDFSELISSVNTNLLNIFIVSLTLILVYATLALLSFTYASTLKGEESHEIIEQEFRKNLYSKLLKNEKHKEVYKAFLKQTIRNKKIISQFEIRRSGESFLLATVLSSLGIFLVYIGFILTKTPLNSHLTFINSFTLKFYYIIILYPLLFGFTRFLKGIYEIFRVIQSRSDKRLIYNSLDNLEKVIYGSFKILSKILEFVNEYKEFIIYCCDELGLDNDKLISDITKNVDIYEKVITLNKNVNPNDKELISNLKEFIEEYENITFENKKNCSDIKLNINFKKFNKDRNEIMADTEKYKNEYAEEIKFLLNK